MESSAAKQRISLHKPLGVILTEMGLVTQDVLKEYFVKQSTAKERLGELLIRDNIISEADLAKAFALQFGCEYLEPAAIVPTKDAITHLSEKVIRAHCILPIEVKNGVLTLALTDPVDSMKLDGVLKMMGVPYQLKISTPTAVRQAIDKAFHSVATIHNIAESLATKDDSSKKTQANVSVEKLVDKIIERAIEEHASDIHIDPAEDMTRIRIRIDGMLHVIDSIPLELHAIVISRLKVQAKMDISEKRTPQDGRFSYSCNQRSVDIRVSTLPTIRGEKAVMRIIDKSTLKTSFESLGMDPEIEKTIRRLLENPHGILFITGPTGSGKTTTLYAMLSHLNGTDKNIITVEDPVEYQFDVINQVQVHERAGLNFAGLLKNILRQDPDILMIGEVRDKETADIAFQAALTGHLVLSTVHTNDAVSTPTRLIDIGIEPFLISSALLGTLSQRLVRVLCSHCKQKSTVKQEDALILGKDLITVGAPIYKRKGCAKCYKTGYLGRISLFELIVPDKTMQRMIIDRKSESEITAYAESQGFRSMRKDGIAKILSGITSVEEVIKATASA